MATDQKKTTEAPAEAFTLDIGHVQFADGGGDGPQKIKMLARSGQAINHWYWGKVVHDLEGMTVLADRIPLDYCHRRDEIIGYGNGFSIDDGNLEITGNIVSWQEDDRAAEIVHKGRAGVPYAASIYFDPENGLRLEEIMPDDVANVNGLDVQGPALIIRKWMLRGAAVCPYGADPHTRSELAANDSERSFPVTIFTQESENMPETTQGQKQQHTTTNPGANQGEAGQQAATYPAEQLEKYCTKFGAENAVAWMKEGLSYEQALERHTEQLTKSRDAERTEWNAERDAAKQRETELAERLAAVDTGEERELETTAGDHKQKKTGFSQFIRFQGQGDAQDNGKAAA